MVNANSIFGGMLTTLGAAKKTNCDALGIPWEPRYMLIGDAAGTDPVPNPAQTQLVNQVYRAQINQLYVSPTDANILIAELVLPPDVGGWWIRELALEDKDGVFSAVANAAPSYKPLLAQGSGRNQVVRMHIITSGTANIQLKIDPSVVLATRQYVDVTINGLLPANKVAGTFTRVVVNDRGVFVSGSNPSTLAGMGITDTFTKTEIAAMIAQASALPVGTQVSFPVNSIPPGFLERDGSVKSIALYPDLAAYLGGAFNRGDEGAGNFRLPESRGEGERGWDHGRGVDAGRAVGSYQAHQTENHAHVTPVNDPGASLSMQSAKGSTWPFGGTPIGIVGTNTISSGVSNIATGEDQWLNTGPNIALGTGETRGRNVAVVMCIKAWNAPINQGNIDIAVLAADIQKLKTMAVVGSYRRLSIVTTGLDGNVPVTAEQVTVGGAEYVKTLNNVGLTINSLSVGANGLDSGAMAASTWYGVWVIWNSATAAIAGLLSLSGTAPLLPAGFTHKALVGWVFTDPTGKPLSQIKKDKRVSWKVAAGSNVATQRRMANGAAGNPSTPTWVAVSTTAYVSPTANSIKVSLVNFTANAAGVAPNAGYGGVSDYLNPPPIASFFIGGSGGAHAKNTGDLLLESASIYWASINENLYCLGYEDSV